LALSLIALVTSCFRSNAPSANTSILESQKKISHLSLRTFHFLDLLLPMFVFFKVLVLQAAPLAGSNGPFRAYRTGTHPSVRPDTSAGATPLWRWAASDITGLLPAQANCLSGS
jgi:hypothetical protein